jgi:hypothetical protein
MKYSIKTLLIGTLYITSVFTNANTNTDQYHKEVLVSLVQSAKTYPLDSLPETSKKFCKEIETSNKKTFTQITDKEIESTVTALSQSVINETYNSLTVEDKKLVIERLISNFFNKDNKDSLHKFIHMLVFIVMTGQTFEELKPVIEKHKKDLDWLADQKSSMTRGAVRILQEFKVRAKQIFDAIPPSVKKSIQEVAKKTQTNINISGKPSLTAQAAGMKIASDIEKETKRKLTADQRNLLPLAIHMMQVRLDLQNHTKAKL